MSSGIKWFNENTIFVKRQVKWIKILYLGLICFISFTLVTCFTPSPIEDGLRSYDCRRFVPIRPFFNASVNEILNDITFKKSVVKKLSGAIKIPTEVFDDTPPPEDSLEPWSNFFEFHEYLEEAFPLVHSHLKLEKVNEVGLLYTWEGTQSEVAPLILMAHQDTVPVEMQTVDQWRYGPFSGHWDQETDFIYGRGAMDCKLLIISLLSSIEKLISDGYFPKRTVLLSFGYDEEAAGKGAFHLARFIENRYGKDSIFLILDEGGNVVHTDDNQYIAQIYSSEKGYLDARINLKGTGGHSSIPPDHTNIGIISDLVINLENDPYETIVSKINPALPALKCHLDFSKQGHDRIFEKLKKFIDQNDFKKVEKEVAKFRELKYLFTTSQAVDVISGGFKANALPETVSVLVNNRVSVDSSVQQTLDHILKHVWNCADKHHFGIQLKTSKYNDSKTIELKPATPNGYIEVVMEDPLEPAPLSPVSGLTWDLLTALTVDLYRRDSYGGADAEVLVTPALGTGNTDTKSYWNLTTSIYRYTGYLNGDSTNEHTVNERCSAESLISAIAFMYTLIPTFDHYTST